MTVAVAEPAQAMVECLDEMRAMLPVLDDERLTTMMREIEGIARRTQSAMLDVVAEIESRGLAAQHGFGGTARLLSGMRPTRGRPAVEHPPGRAVAVATAGRASRAG